MILLVILGFLAALSCALMLWQYVVALRFPLHRRVESSDFAPAVTLLKPLRGCDAETRDCLQSWLCQTYRGERQILFGVASPSDPVCDVVRELIVAYPHISAELVICHESLGPNAKVSSLIQLYRRAKHDVIVVSDADVRVLHDFLANAVEPLKNSETGLVNCFYRYANPGTRAMEWEAIAVNADFWSQVLQSQSLKPIDFALGAVMTTRRKNLDQIGGFQSLVDYLADDYQLGNRIAKTGGRIVISPIVVECWESPRNWSQVWHHQLRWARTIRVCQPAPFFFSILSNATLWPCLFWVFAIKLLPGARFEVSCLVAILLLIRLLAAWGLQGKLVGGQGQVVPAWLALLKDLFGFAIWALAFFGNEIEWRGEKFQVQPGGKLQKI